MPEEIRAATTTMTAIENNAFYFIKGKMEFIPWLGSC
jgi:hypothetical protein